MSPLLVAWIGGIACCAGMGIGAGLGLVWLHRRQRGG